MVAPALFVTAVVVLFLTWSLHSHDWIMSHFDYEGVSPVESATIGLLYAVIGFLWFFPTMRSPKARLFWRIDFSLVTLIAICRELDWHKLLVHCTNLPGASHGTPFKMSFLTNHVNPLGDKLIVLACFAIFFVILGGTLFYFIRRLVKGLFKFHPVCWSIAFIGGTSIISQVCDRMPSVLRKGHGINFSDSTLALLTTFEEGLELLLPVFAIVAIIQAYFIYVADDDDGSSLEEYRKL
jgi:hypothetical protein